MNKKNFFKSKILVCSISIAFGLFMIIFGIIDNFKRHSEYTLSAKFGADFYTEQYAATKAAANNIADVSDTLNDLGIIICISFTVCKLLKTPKYTVPK